MIESFVQLQPSRHLCPKADLSRDGDADRHGILVPGVGSSGHAVFRRLIVP